jgi:uncharacterized protein (TIGR02996 family)
VADLMAIVSKAVFEKAAGKTPKVGTKLAMDRYVSANKNLEPLAAGGRLYLVTVRPPNEALWLVAVLDKPKFDGAQWLARPCDKPIVDVSSLRGRLKFESGKGITAAAGALGMSLQTPRILTADDAALLDGAFIGAPVAEAAAAAPEAAPETDRRNLLLRAVLADPDHVAPRQVFADELTAHNDPRGEFILLDLALEGGLSIRKREQLKQRRDALKREHASAWWPYKIPYRTRAGFIEFVAGSFQQLVSLAPKLFAAEPVTEVQISGIDPEDNADKLVKLKWLANLHALIVRGSIGDEAFAKLCAAPAAAKLRALNVTANELSAEAFEGLGAGLPACRALVLTANEFGDDGVAALREWRHLDQLETLYLSKCDLSSAGVATLIGKPLPNLRKLYLTGNVLGGAVAKAFVKHAANLPALRHLELCTTDLDTGDVTALAKAQLPSIVRIDVRRNNVAHGVVSALGERFRA